MTTHLYRPLRQGAFAAFLLGAVSAIGCASAEVPPLQTAGPAVSAEATRFHIERNGFTKKVTFRAEGGSGTVTMKYKGVPVAWGSPINLLVDEEFYELQSHRVRYRFQHPRSARPVVLVARGRTEYVDSVPIRSAPPLLNLFDGGEKESWGSLLYDYKSRTLFAGDIEGRPVEIERVSPDSALDRSILKYLFPFPVSGEFVIRIDGREAARFTQHRANGFISPYDLALGEETDPATRDVAMLAFVVFDLMKEFVQLSAG